MLASQHDLSTVLISILIACLASYVALDLARRVDTERGGLSWWLLGGSLAMGSGVWSMHFIGMAALELPIAIGYDASITFVSWVAAAGVSWIALRVASSGPLTWSRSTIAALAMGAGICAMHYLGMTAMLLTPMIVWNLWLVAASALIAVVASAAALVMFRWVRCVSDSTRLIGQLCAALVMGLAIAGMHYTGMAAASFPEDSFCLAAGQLSGAGLNAAVAVVTGAMLALTLIITMIDARLKLDRSRLTTSLDNATDELRRIAFRDPLTGLSNRMLFEDQLDAAVAKADQEQVQLALLFIDLDGFKPINDSFGHGTGDQVLKTIATRLKQQTPEHAHLARIGGDEFVMLMGQLDDATTASIAAEAILELVAAPITLDDREVQVSCSIGIAVYPAAGPVRTLMARADAAMYAAKRDGGSGYRFFEAHMDADARDLVDLRRDFRNAIADNQLELHYQPKVDVLTGTVPAVEALVRWRHPTRGLLQPQTFIPMLERFGLIGALGTWVIDEACRQAAQWSRQGHAMSIAVNLSIHQVRAPDLVSRIERSIARHDVDPQLLVFELTESAAMDDPDRTMGVFDQLAKIGSAMSIDDFGTGYSSLAYLRKLPAQELKIDRNFIMDLERSSDARAIVEAVVRLAHALGLNVVAEGVETEAQRVFLTDLGCDQLQGFLFAKALPPERLLRWIDSRQAPGTERKPGETKRRSASENIASTSKASPADGIAPASNTE
ncbi:bifunctional diguanylate cyclase/phosphodiesterase [soil metagenome]